MPSCDEFTEERGDEQEYHEIRTERKNILCNNGTYLTYQHGNFHRQSWTFEVLREPISGNAVRTHPTDVLGTSEDVEEEGIW